LVGLQHRGGQLTGLVCDQLEPLRMPEGFLEPPFPKIHGARRVFTDFDEAILAIPVGSMQKILARDASLGELPGLAGVRRLTTVAPMGLHVWHRAPVTRGPRTLVAGLLPPMAIALDNKPFNPAYRDDPAFGSVLHFVGQETGFEDWSDRDLLERAIAGIQRVDGYEGIDLEGIITWRLVRDRVPHRRYWLSEPGSLKHKPWPESPLRGLTLAGDWVRSDADFPCMETAVRSGLHAARVVLKSRQRRADAVAGRAA
jgi:hypothetical protein